MMIDLLFVGNFLSKKNGTFPVSENIAKELIQLGYSVYLSSSYQTKALRLFDIIFTTLFRSYKNIHIDVFSGPAFIIAEVSSLLSRFRKKRSILTLHGGNLPVFYASNKKRIRSVFSRADYIQTPSISLQKFFALEGFEVNYLPNPLNVDSFPFKRDCSSPISLLWVRAFSEIYHPELAVNVLFELKKNYPEITLTMIGPDKGNLAEIRNKIAILDLKKSVNIIGPVKNNKLHKFYQSHDIFINTTRIESFGVAVVEAASCGIPIVSTSVGELELLWEHDENILFAKNNQYSFAFQITRLLESEDLKLRLAQNARARSEEFDSRQIIKLWSDILVV